MSRPKIITLCGSTRFFEEFDKANLMFTLEGWIVLNIGCNTRCDNSIFANMSESELEEIKTKLDELHFRKIEMSDAVFIINKNGYIGESTSKELDYAKELGKELLFLEPEFSIFSYLPDKGGNHE